MKINSKEFFHWPIKVYSFAFIFIFFLVLESFGQVPAAPDKLGGVGVSSSSVILNWVDKSSNETGFEIERSTTFGVGYTLITTTTSNVRSYTDTGLTAGTTYYYRVRAINGSGSSTYVSNAGVQVARSDYRRFLLDFGDPAAQTTTIGWNNITSVANGTTVPLKDTNGNTTTLSLEVVQAANNNYGGNANDWNSAGYNGQVADYPTSACNDSHFAWSGGGSYSLTGLDNSKVYDLRIFGSRAVSNADRVGLYTINGQQKLLNGANNSSETILFSNISPVDATITINFNVAQGSTFGYLNVLDIIESTNPSPPPPVVKLTLTPGMVGSVPAGLGDPTFLVDEQALAGEPAIPGQGGAPTTHWRSTTGVQVMSVQVDLGATYVIKQIWLFDGNGSATLPNGYQIIGNTSTGDVPLVNSAMTSYLKWVSFDVDATTRMLTIINPTGFIGMNELVLYGYPTGSSNAPPISNAGADQTVTLPTNSILLTGSGSDTDGTIATYLWTQVSGPNSAVLSGNNTNSLTATSLVSGSYVFRLFVTDNQGSFRSDDVTVTVSAPDQGPAEPGKLGAAGVSSSTVVLNWVDNSSNELGFEIERSLTYGSGYSVVANTTSNITTYTDSGLTAGTTYYYRVRAVNAIGNSSYATHAGVQVARSDYRRFLLDFGDPAGQTNTVGWNNISSIANGTTVSLKDNNDNATAVSLEVVQAPANNYGGSSNDWNSAGYNGQVADYPISACNDSHIAWSGGGSYRLTGLDNSKVYDLRIFGSRATSNSDHVSLYAIGDQQKLLNAANNSSETILFSNIMPDAGAITISFQVAQGSSLGYLNVLDIIESTSPLPPPTIVKLTLTPTMVSAINPANEGNPALLVDEQSLAGNPAGGSGGQPITSWGTNLGPKPMSAQIDLGIEYAIKEVWLFDTNGTATLPDGYKVIANTSGGDITLVNSEMVGYQTWSQFNVDVTTRRLTIINPTGYLGMTEIVLYGYMVGVNEAPVANAGSDQTIGLPNNTVSIAGSGTDSDGTIASYLWTQVSGPSTAILSGNNSSTVTASSLVAGTYVLRLSVTDNLGSIGSDEVMVTVNNQGTVTKLSLTPSMVTAVNPIDEGNPVLLVDEQVLAGDPASGTGGQPTTNWGTNLAPKVMSAQIDLGAAYKIKQVWLFDTNGVAALPDGYKVIANTALGDVILVNSSMTGYMTWNSATVDVTTRTLTIINPTGYVGMNELVLYGYYVTASPVANAGADKLTTTSTSNTLLSGNGIDSDGTISSYSWNQVSGPNTATLSGNSSATVTISSLMVGTYVFRLTVTDDLGATGSDEVTVTVSDDGLVPDALELEALRRIAEGSSDDRLSYYGWPSVSNWPVSATSTDFGSWPGVTVINQDIVELAFTGDYFGFIPDAELPQLTKLNVSNSLLYGIHASMPNLEELRIAYNVFSDIPDLSDYPTLKFLGMSGFNNGGYCGACDLYDSERTDFNGRNVDGGPDLSSLTELEFYEGDVNNFVTFPTGLIALTQLKSIYLFNNYLQSVPTELANFTQLVSLNLAQNYITDLPPTLGDLPNLQSVVVSQNRLDFGDLEQFFIGVNEFKNANLYLEYGNQGNLPPLNVTASAGKYTLINNRGGGIHSHYQWQEFSAGSWVSISGKTLKDLVFNNMDQSYAGKRYRCEITNDWITDLTIYSSEFTIESVTDFPLLAPGSLTATAGTSLSINLSWVDNTADETGFEIERASTTSGDFENVGLTAANAVSYSDAGLTEGTSYHYRIRAVNATGSSDYSNEASATPAYNMDELITQDSLLANVIPPQVKITRDGRIPISAPAPSHPLNTLNQEDDKVLFPGCVTGSYYVGFELKYDLSDKNTTLEWLSKLQITLMEGATVIWQRPLLINSKNQNFVSVAFYDQPISCDLNPHFIISQKLNIGAVPEASIYLNQYLYEVKEFDFSTASSPIFVCPEGGNGLGFNASTGESSVRWNYADSDATEYDLEWVFLAEHEIDVIPNFNNTAAAAFQNKEAVRITTAETDYKHLIFYQTGKLWYRVRAVSYNPANPEHRITGAWFYSNCPYLEIDNPEPTKNWQVQTVFAEEGKYKKVVHYFDGTLRTRQSQTNLSTEGITMTGETLYDFEGRKAVEILAAPSEVNYNSTLTFKPGINTFQAIDAAVTSNTTPTRIKFNYDNQLAANSKLSTTDGAGRYYSTANTRASVHEMLIPDGEGFVYSQTEYLNDGTGRIRRQSGVGEEFRMDGNHATRYYYGSASKAELVRLFGSNVGKASHYKKNLVVDGNGQVSVSYHDQSDRVIATALAGKNPESVDPLTSLSDLENNPDIIISLNDKHERNGAESITTHKILNTVPNIEYNFNYDLTAVNPIELGCPQCKLDFTISITDPDGKLVDLGMIQDNQSTDTHYFSIYNFSGVACSPSEINVQFSVDFSQIGDYTITKKLVARQLSYEELKTVVTETPAAQQKIQELIIAYNQIDYEKCAVCTTQPEVCTDAENAIIDAFNTVATLDCENILLQIKEDLRTTHPDGFDQADIEGHPDYCRYELCLKDKESDVFDKQLARITAWSDPKRISDPFEVDPFFSNPNLSGNTALLQNSMSSKISNYIVTQINGITFSGSIEDITDHTYAPFYIDDFGNKTNSNTTGRHILYMDLMARKAQMPSAAYIDELDQQRWALYKSFYLEAKRRTKIEAYTSICSAAVTDLQQVENIPTTQQGVINWSAGSVVTDPVSDEQLDVILNSIKLSCVPSGPFFDPDTTPLLTLTDPEAQQIKNLLRAYFNSKPANIFRVIIITDLGTDPNLAQINSILSSKGCGLAALAQEDPAVCLNERLVNFDQPANLVQNPEFNDCGNNLNNSECIWSPANGTPTISTVNGVKHATLEALRCSPSADALRGKLAAPLVPGQKYKLSVTYRPSANSSGGATVSNAYLQFTQSQLYSPSSIYDCNQVPFSQGGGESSNNLAPPSDDPVANVMLPPAACNPLNLCCTDPGVSDPDPVFINNILRSRAWESGPLSSNLNEPNWITQTILFTPISASTDFVFSIVNQQNPYGCQINTWGTKGTFENSSDNTYDNYFAGLTNSYGILNSGEGRSGENSLGIRLNQPPNPCPPGFECPYDQFGNIVNNGGTSNSVLAYLDANEFGYGQADYEVFVWVKTPTSNYISNNEQRQLYLDVQDPSITISGRNYVTLQSTNNTWQKLSMFIHSPLPQRILLKSDILDSEVLTSGVLLIDDYFVAEFLGINEESIDIKDVSIVQDTIATSFSYCTEYATPIAPDYLSEFTIKCSENLVNESIVLRERAIEKYLEEEITTFSNTYRANCLDGATENLQYSYNSKEYHYTLYYYDQAGNLVQTVPPEGVRPDPVNEPQHKLITRYQYNSLNQLLAQTTPDAGESKFWYNDKSQLKLSQNAQQLIDNQYSYTKYDEQGRITEVGEMAATGAVEDLIAQFDDPAFPREQNMQTPGAGTYVLTDVTRTHYDYDFENPALINITQQQLRNRVSWVEVTDQESQTPLILEAISVYKNEGVLNGVNTQGVLASEVTQSGQTYLRVQNNCSGGCSDAGIAFFTPMPVTIGETYLFKAKGYSTTSEPVHFDIKGNGTQSLAMFSTGGAALPVSAGAEGWITQTVVVPPGVTFLTINLTWDSPALNEVFFVNEFEIVKQTIDYYSSRTATYYSYDIHGNVKSLVQKVPGLTPKRTDYVYDLVSGKVNFVMYQYDEQDQFIHRYLYDADNRITEVRTSTDGFVWDKDAEYMYYLHGPLARVELGEHRVQGLDYYYTLQGWLKGVNSPTGTHAQINDPGTDGVANALNAMVGKDVFAYNLGYFNGDYKPIGGTTARAALIETGSTGLWTSGTETLGLYNGNISWMATDLAKIGLENNNRNTGVQAMQYRYDQLHRIVRSRSLSYASGVATRTGSAYDEDYTYDANGNLLTLLRNNELGVVKDNFTYRYYAGTNRLSDVAPVTDDVTYNGAVTSNSKLYRTITVEGNAYLPAGADVTLRATENIFIKPEFNKAGGNSFHAYITDEGVYQYDAIGNLIIDNSEGTKISWTPYGKVRQVKAKGDSVVIDYRYDATGNRIQKRIRTLSPDSYQDGEGWGEVTTNYVRDASGNVMTIYQSLVGGSSGGATAQPGLPAGALAQAGVRLLEQPIYGSSRLGQYKGGRKEGQRLLGRKQFELSNHLGNVLTVITDNITMSPTEGVSATIVSATDYYPFGLEMDGRTYSDTTYRYGFNGKEKDAAFGSTNNYDYGFRIYNPEIAKFLSVDPLTRSYPWYTPYQFAGNMPIWAIDVDGLEPSIVAGSKNQVESVNETPENKNHVGIELVNLKQLYNKILEHKEKGNKIELLYIQNHGNPGSLYIKEGKDGKFNTTAVGRNQTYTLDDKPVKGDVITLYNQLTPEQRRDPKEIDQDNVIAIENFKRITDLTEKNATIIIAGCYCALDQEGLREGTELITSLAILTQRKIIANQDFTADLYRGGFLDLPRTSSIDFVRGFRLAIPIRGPNGGFFAITPHLKKAELKLNSNGNLYTITPK